MNMYNSPNQEGIIDREVSVQGSCNSGDDNLLWKQ